MRSCRFTCRLCGSQDLDECENPSSRVTIVCAGRKFIFSLSLSLSLLLVFIRLVGGLHFLSERIGVRGRGLWFDTTLAIHPSSPSIQLFQPSSLLLSNAQCLSSLLHIRSTLITSKSVPLLLLTFSRSIIRTVVDIITEEVGQGSLPWLQWIQSLISSIDGITVSSLHPPLPFLS